MKCSIDTVGGDHGASKYRLSRSEHWDRLSKGWRGVTWLSSAYHRRIAQIHRYLIPADQRVLQIGCGRGDLLAAVKPSYGVGLDFSQGMISEARQKYPDLHFVHADIHDAQFSESFDTIILSDVVNDLWDVQTAFDRLRQASTPQTRLVVNYYSRLWQIPLRLATQFRCARPQLEQNWLVREDMENLLKLAGFEVVREWQEVLWPLPLPILGNFLNRYLVKLWPFRMFALQNFIVARPIFTSQATGVMPSVSVVVPARNEAGNIQHIIRRLPEMGSRTEVIFVEGGSTDNTYEEIERCIQSAPEGKYLLFKQKGKGKGDAVRCGFEHATGDVLMILDADISVAPEDLPRFYNALATGSGEFINGVRLVYPMEKQAMQGANFVANKFFGLAFSWVLGQPVKDTLCGTKVLWKKDYVRIQEGRAYFGDFDPFGDFDLLFGAAKLNLRIIDMPVRYGARSYGSTNIQRWRHGVLLFQMLAVAGRKLKFAK